MGENHPNVCAMLSRNRRLAYFGRCQVNFNKLINLQLYIQKQVNIHSLENEFKGTIDEKQWLRKLSPLTGSRFNKNKFEIHLW